MTYGTISNNRSYTYKLRSNRSAANNDNNQSNSSEAPSLKKLSDTMQASRELNRGWRGESDGKTRVVLIDDFVTDETGYNHGEHMDRIIKNGGTTTSGILQGSAGEIETVRININDGGNRNLNIASALDQVATRAADGEEFDAVNLSQQEFADSEDAALVRDRIDLLQNEFGIPVVVAAGNNGDATNTLSGSAAFVVENSRAGVETRAEGSGSGNLRSEGYFTSQATANVTPRVAQLRERGYSIQQIDLFLGVESRLEGGSLDAF